MHEKQLLHKSIFSEAAGPGQDLGDTDGTRSLQRTSPWQSTTLPKTRMTAGSVHHPAVSAACCIKPCSPASPLIPNRKSSITIGAQQLNHGLGNLSFSANIPQPQPLVGHLDPQELTGHMDDGRDAYLRPRNLSPVHPNLSNRDPEPVSKPCQLHVKTPPLQALVRDQDLGSLAVEELEPTLCVLWTSRSGYEKHEQVEAVHENVAVP
mmetsp:Transcript_38182/g.107887  ORF Transcript_38182/g.107887 Transcript_38182/m.107887 type:complete len:208 (+) Transcript_38182:281-904(+)